MPPTLTEKVHEAAAFRLTPARLKLFDPATVVIVPPQLLLNPFGDAICNPAGRVSVKETPLKDCPAFGLVTVKVSEVVPFKGIVAAPKAWVTAGVPMTVSVADAVEPAPLSLEEIALVVLTNDPAASPMTSMLNVQEPLASSAAPDKVMLVSLGLAVMTPLPQPPVRLLGDETANPEGSGSLKLTPLSELAFGLVRVKVRLVVPLIGIEAAPKAGRRVGGVADCA